MVAETMGEPQRSQYLEAMGLTVWVSRYRLPNALVTSACEWQETPIAPQRPPAQRLHALLETPSAPHADGASDAPAATPAAAAGVGLTGPTRLRRARAMLGEPANEPESALTESGVSEPATVSPSGEPHQALHFTLQVAALDGRWLILHVADSPPDASVRRLLGNLLKAAAIEPAQPVDFQSFRWPLMDNLPVEAPVEEARDGLRAFIEGRRQRGWQPERVLLFGEHADLEQVLELGDGYSHLLALPAWCGPSLVELAESATAKRGVLPMLAAWQAAWRFAISDEANGEQHPVE